MAIKRKKLVQITYREFCRNHICACCPEYNKKQRRCCISTDLRIAENADWNTCSTVPATADANGLMALISAEIVWNALDSETVR